MPEFIMPIASGLFLVLIGVGIGYFLWFRDRTQEEAVKRKLRSDNSELKNLQAEHQSTLRASQDELAIRDGKLHILQELCDDLVSGRAQFQTDRVELETEISSQRRQLEEFKSRLEEERRLQGQQADKLQAELLREREKQAATENEWRQQVKGLETELAARQTDVRHLTEHSERTAAELHEAKSLVASLHTELETQCSMLATASQNANGLEREYVSLETSLRNHTDLLKESRAQAAAADSARAIAENALADLRCQLNDQQLHIENLDKIRIESEVSKQECITLHQTIADFDDQVIRLKKQRNEAIENIEQTHIEQTGLVTRLENQESTIRNLRDQLDQQILQQRADAESRLVSEADERARLARTRSELQQQIQELESLKIINEELSCQVAQGEHDRQKSRAMIEQLEQNLLTKIAESSELNKQVIELKNERAQLNKSLREREASTSQQLAKIRSRVEHLQRDAMQHQARITTLMREREEMVTQLAGFEEMHQESTQLLELQRTEIQTRLKMMLSQRDQAFDEANQLRGEVKRLRAETAAQRKQMAQLQSASSEFVALPFSQETTDSVNGGKTQIVAGRGRIYTEPPTVPDELNCISGITDAMEQRLNEYGVFTYEQIMQWDDAAVEEFATLLQNSMEAIKNDGWVEQARMFYEINNRRAA